jgi:hypothetical protein
MNGFIIDLDKPCLSETEIVDIAVECLLDGCPMSECRGYLLSGYGVNPDGLCRLLEKAQREVRECEVEFGAHVRF